LFASLEMMRQTFSSLSGTNGLAKGLAMQPTLDPAELEKKINELKSVESWLKLNLSMLSSTIQGMEVQLATITTLQQFMTANQAVANQATTGVESQVTPPAQASTEAAQAWWNMLTQQFGQIAAATSASMGASPSADPVSRSTSDARGVKDNQVPTKKTRVRAAPKKST
jgi:peptidoglycan hydrolase CwlO-like protein